MRPRPLFILVLATLSGMMVSFSTIKAAVTINPTLKNLPDNTWYKIGSNPDISAGILSYKAGSFMVS